MAEVRAITVREEREREGDLEIWEASFCSVEIAIVDFEGWEGGIRGNLSILFA